MAENEDDSLMLYGVSKVEPVDADSFGPLDMVCSQERKFNLYGK